MEDDAAALGWHRLLWAKKAKVSPATITRFCKGAQTPVTAAKLAKPLGRLPRHYVVRRVPGVAPVVHGERALLRARVG